MCLYVPLTLMQPQRWHLCIVMWSGSFFFSLAIVHTSQKSPMNLVVSLDLLQVGQYIVV
jgi:hypothetical protein